MPEQVLTGIPTTPGIAIGEVALYRHDEPGFREFCVVESGRDAETKRFGEAVENTRRQLKLLRDELAKQVGETVAEIFDFQISILDDEMLLGDVRQQILDNGLNAEAAVYGACERIAESLAVLSGDNFRLRAQDVKDVGRRILQNLLGVAYGAHESYQHPVIIVADDLLPSDVIHLLQENVQAVATDLGGAASHTAILTRSLEVPAVVGLRKLSLTVKNGEIIILNGNSGKVIINPAPNTVAEYKKKRARFEEHRASLVDLERLPAETLDGKKIALRANLELPQEVRSVLQHGGEGVGLFRSEYLFLARKRLPSEEDQVQDYRSVIEAVAPHPVTIRTFDLGGDKIFPDIPHPVEANPFMGWRAVRVSLDQPNFLHTQLRAILRAAVAGPTKIMFPLISGLDEIRQVKQHFTEVTEQLTREGLEFDPNVELGVMIELPSAVLMADKMALEVDFFSIGTNDLTQFTLAVDRGNEFVRNRYSPLHPAIIRMIKMTVDAGHNAGIKVALCGELAGNPLAAMLLVGLGLDELSVSPVVLPEIKKLIRSMYQSEADEFVRKVMEFDNAPELAAFCYDSMKHRFAELPIWFNDDL